MAKYASFVGMYTSGQGAGDITLDGAALPGHRTVNDIWGASGQEWLAYYLKDADGVNWERGYCRVTLSTNFCERDYVKESTNANAKINLSAGQHIFIVAAHPDMAQRRGFTTQGPITAGSLVPLVIPSGSLRRIPFDTRNMIWDSEGDYAAQQTDDSFAAPLWVGSMRVSAMITWPENVTGNRLLMLKPSAGPDYYMYPQSNIPGANKVSTNTQETGVSQHICSGIIPKSEIGAFGIWCAQDSGGDLTLDSLGWVTCEYLD